MSSRKVTNWLQSHRLGAYVDVFAEHEVTWDDLGELGEGDLRKMGLKTRERRRLLRAIAVEFFTGGGETLSMCKNSLCGVQDLQPLLGGWSARARIMT
jgi:SAM (Sterile alpha motif) domain-containing protein